MQKEYDVVIVGTGLAGLTAALAMPTDYRVAVLMKAPLLTCSSHLAQGGIAAVIDQSDHIDRHILNTHIAGAGLCHLEHTRHILEQAPLAIDWLIEQGVEFDQVNGELHLTQEGGHDHRRIVHVADHTGLAVMQVLADRVLAAKHIECITDVTLDSLCIEHGQCQGVRYYTSSLVESQEIKAASTVLATGGVGQLFAHTTNAAHSFGDGLAVAWQAGCRLVNLEMVQFHPTALALPNAAGFLISEALRGEGGILRNAVGHRFMPDYDHRAELAPRDIVARANGQEQLKYHQPVVLDMTHLADSFIQAHFPSIYQYCLSLGLNICQQPIPVTPAAHYHCGGVLANHQGLTDLPQLYAIGEVACTGLHGANRLASNSLLECVVTGLNVSQHISSKAKWVAPQIEHGHLVQYETVIDDLPEYTDFSMTQLKKMMSEHLGLLRDQAGLITLYTQLMYWKKQQPQQKQIIVALLMVCSALTRLESRGVHYRQDHQHTETSPTWTACLPV
ncbi:L-aspartate oxidase [Acinetobacter apis]|uniref:L-aspartate oxidase n=1 Tax=Acinetobacter apis TaxID=1229165 RepID=A0A217EFB0_9GAMM|nr:L-aspartate oxidase [Acinetobacter apis]SNQ29179.1 L-aspartate oxidase [Acinetobacter apis]